MFLVAEFLTGPKRMTSGRAMHTCEFDVTRPLRLRVVHRSVYSHDRQKARMRGLAIAAPHGNDCDRWQRGSVGRHRRSTFVVTIRCAAHAGKTSKRCRRRAWKLRCQRCDPMWHKHDRPRAGVALHPSCKHIYVHVCVPFRPIRDARRTLPCSCIFAIWALHRISATEVRN
jgi:hypothetical protein